MPGLESWAALSSFVDASLSGTVVPRWVCAQRASLTTELLRPPCLRQWPLGNCTRHTTLNYTIWPCSLPQPKASVWQAQAIVMVLMKYVENGGLCEITLHRRLSGTDRFESPSCFARVGLFMEQSHREPQAAPRPVNTYEWSRTCVNTCHQLKLGWHNEWRVGNACTTITR